VHPSQVAVTHGEEVPMRFPSRARLIHCGATLLLLTGCSEDQPQSPSDEAGAPTLSSLGTSLYDAGAASSRFNGACARQAYRQFDFWVGKSEITDPMGNPAGTNIISKELDGCAVLENYEASGFVGRSLNSYDRATNHWHQHWVDHQGAILDLYGGFQNGAMVMQGIRPTPAGDVLDRITWTPLSGGELRQLWETSTDGGQTFPGVIFDGIYHKRQSLVREPEIPQTFCTDQTLPALFQFDFTLGEWKAELVEPGRSPEVRSTITSGCLIEERIKGKNGYEAIVFTSVRRRLGIWVKTFVDNRGTNVFLKGGLTNGEMVLTGTMPDRHGSSKQVRVTWTEKTADRFVQRWETTDDGGATWKRLFKVRYTRG
jgi:hypothetical protein